MSETLEIYLNILKRKYPQHHFELNIGGNSLFVYGKEDNSLYNFCENLSESMLKPIKKIAFIKIQQ
jgi:hypothetical protein